MSSTPACATPVSRSSTSKFPFAPVKGGNDGGVYASPYNFGSCGGYGTPYQNGSPSASQGIRSSDPFAPVKGGNGNDASPYGNIFGNASPSNGTPFKEVYGTPIGQRPVAGSPFAPVKGRNGNPINTPENNFENYVMPYMGDNFVVTPTPYNGNRIGNIPQNQGRSDVASPYNVGGGKNLSYDMDFC
jgi:hypothetical protein